MPGNGLGFEYRENVVFHRQFAEDGRLLRQIAYTEVAGAQVHRNIGNVLIVDYHPACVGGNKTDDDVETGGFAGPVGAQKAYHFTLFQAEADTVDDPASAVTFPDLISR